MDIHDLADLYVVGALDDDETNRFEAHLPACESCRREIESLGRGLEVLADAVYEEPPVGLRDRVLESIAATSQPVDLAARRRRSTRRIVGAAAAVLVLVVGVLATLLLRTDPIDSVVTAADAVRLTVPATDAYEGAAQIQLVVSAVEGRAVVLATDLASAGAGQTYQMWLIAPTGPIPAGLFQPDDEGDARALVDGSPQAGLVFGITQEPAGGSPAPTGQVLFAAPV